MEIPHEGPDRNMPKIKSSSTPTNRLTDTPPHRLTDSPIHRTVLLFIIATIPLPYASVQPVIWTAFAALIFFLFIYGLWRDQLDFRFMKSSWLIFSPGLFFIYTLIQAIPIPVEFLRFLNPFQYHVVVQTSVLLEENITWHSLSYVSSASFAWWIWLLSLFLFFRILSAYIANPRILVQVVAVMMAVGLAEAIYGLMQTLIPTLGVLQAKGSGNARGTFINRNHFAGFMEMVWPMSLGLILAKAHLWAKDGVYGKSRTQRLKIFLSSDRIGLQLLMISALLFILLALLFSGSRAGITGAFIGFIAYVLFCRLGSKKLSVSAGAAMGLGFAFLLFYGGVIGLEPIIERFLAIDDSAGSRMDIWKDTIAMVKAHPFGIGLGNFEHVMPVFNAHGFYGIKYTHAHNDYLQLLAETGWPGFISLVGGFYLFLGKSILRIRRLGSEMDPVRFYISLGAVSGLISIAFHSFFDFNLQIPANMLYFVALMAIVASGEQREDDGGQKMRR